MRNQMMVVVNPNAGKGGYKTVLGDILRAVCNGGWEPTVFFSRAAGEIPGLVADRAADFDRVVCLGGDGTLSETAAGMLRSGAGRPIGYIPLGTANDVARTLGLSSRPSEAARHILEGKTVPVDLGQFGADDYFTYVAAFGAFTDVSYATSQETKQALGHLAYMLQAVGSLGSITAYHALVEYDGGVLEGRYVFGAITNSTSVAGLVQLDKGTVDLSDGMFEVLLVKEPQDILEFGDIVSSVLSNDFSSPNINFFKSSRVHVRFEVPVAWTRDGENGGRHSEVVIRNRHPGVEILV